MNLWYNITYVKKIRRVFKMAWVTKDSVEQYETPESKKEYTKQEKAANWWYYHKLYVGIAVIAVVLVGCTMLLPGCGRTTALAMWAAATCRLIR